MQGDSAMKAGDWVEVRPLSEILATLDAHGCLDSMPFMPEMAGLCGTRFQIWKSAHKTCDPTGATDLRRMKDAVHGTTRCSGEAHGGCEARCLIFWKKDWLKPVNGPAPGGAVREQEPADLGVIASGVLASQAGDDEIRYRCQATEILNATTPLPPYMIDQYVQDVASGNVSAANVASRVLSSAAGGVYSRLSGAIVGKASSAGAPPATPQAIKPEPLDLKRGDIVEVRSADEIMRTLNRNWKNRGLVFEREMLGFCGKQFRVIGRVARLIDEKTGRLLELKNDCVILEGLYCSGVDKRSRLFCPRAPYYYWREAWLRRTDVGSETKGDAA
jgi:hypothetical protein